MTAEELAEREQEAKMTKLENSELMMQQHDVSEDTNKNDTFANQLVTRILNNLQFSIQTIHIRYEDNVSTEHRFAAGITLNELSAITTDEEWTPNTLGEAANTIYKVKSWVEHTMKTE
jgi:vacuolar protein sorting-associated protein 13A/C